MHPKCTPIRQQFVKVCECGCGQPTLLASKTSARAGWVSGQPMRYLPQHHSYSNAAEYLIDEATGCWLWQRDLDAQGYGRLRRGGRTMSAHAWFYEQKFGPVPAGKVLDHVASRGCKGAPCVNPDHLEPVTQLENVRRGRKAKLTIGDVRQIRALAATTPYKDLASRFGVAPSSISNIVAGRLWPDHDAS